MANKNFVVKNGLTVGNLSVAADSGNITTTGSLSSAAVFTDGLFYANGTPYTTLGFTGSGGVGYTGSKGDTGLGFRIAKSYANVSALSADTTPTGIVAGEFAIVETGNVELPDNSKLYLWNGSSYSFVTDLSGAAGLTGPQGTTGFVGSTGDTGFVGSQGDVGFTGSKGDTGFVGSKGDTGFVGSRGDIGFVGSQGNTGFVGSKGDTGFVGSQGPIGYSGSNATLSNWSIKTANYTAISGDRIIANTSGGSFYITLPAAPSIGNSVTITDGASFLVNSLFVLSNGSTIESQSTDIEIDIGQVTVEFFYDNNTWQIISTAGPRGYTGSRGVAGASGYSTFTVSTSTQANINSRYIVDTNTSNVTITLPLGPAAGDEVSIIDGTGNASVHPITVARNNSKIQGLAEDLTIQTNRAGFALVYYDSQNGWVLTNV